MTIVAGNTRPKPFLSWLNRRFETQGTEGVNYLKRSTVSSMAGLLLLALLSGCSLLKTPEFQIEPRLELALSHNGLESATVVYKVARSTGDMQTLSIVYPHPQKGRGVALAEVLVIRSAQGVGPDDREAGYGAWDPRGWVDRFGSAARKTMPGVALGESIKEAKALDIPKHELDDLFSQLERTGFFSETSGATIPVSTTDTVTVDLTALVNGARFAKTLSRVEALDKLLRTVRQKGRLVSYRRSAAESRKPSRTIRQPPERLYRQLAQRGRNSGAARYDAPLRPSYSPEARVSRLPPLGNSK